jgi:ABC-2 type transport system permease protein
MNALIIRIIKQLINDKWTIILIFIAPLLVMLLAWLILGGGNGYKSNIAVFGLPNVVMAGLLTSNVNVIELDNIDNIDTLLLSNSVDVVVHKQGSTWTVRALEADTKYIKAMKEIQSAVTGISPMGRLNVEFVYDSTNDNLFNSLAYVFLGVVVFMFSFMFAGISFVRERLNQTLERVLITPVKPYQIVGGYMLGYGIISVIQGMLILFFAIYILDVPLKGSIFLCILIMALLSFSAVAMGNIISTFTNTEAQIMQLAPLILIPQVFFSGLIPLETIPSYVSFLRYLMPIYYGCAPLKEVMKQGSGLLEISIWLLCLLSLILVVFLLNLLTIRKSSTL